MAVKKRDVITGIATGNQSNNGVKSGDISFQYSKRQFVGSVGHPWPPQGGNKGLDIGGDFSYILLENVKPNLANVHVDSKSKAVFKGWVYDGPIVAWAGNP